MKTIIFGAGASYDSIYEYYYSEKERLIETDNGSIEHPFTPPLARQLFSTKPEIQRIINEYQGAKSQQDSINRISDVEKYLGDLYDDYKSHNDKIAFTQFLNIQFYLQKLLFEFSKSTYSSGLSNYQDIINKVHKYCLKNNTEIALITFNYDLLLEFSLKKLYGIDNFQIEDYLKHPIKLFKPHGSSNWVKYFYSDVKANISRMSIFHSKYPDFALGNKINPAIVLNENPDTLFVSKTDHIKPYLPVIAVPTYGKDSLLLDDKMKQYLDEHLAKTTEILIIGWRATENIFLDYLNQTLKNKSPELTIVDPYPIIARDNLRKILPNCVFLNTENLSNEDLIVDFQENSYYNSFTRFLTGINQTILKSFFD